MPQSQIEPGAATRTPGTKCTAYQFTSGELYGFDVDVSVEIAKRLEVEPCFVMPDWKQVTSGNWQDQWDISIGSMAITSERTKTLLFTQPYYATLSAFFVHRDNTKYSRPGNFSGMKIGVCTGCTYQFYLEKTLNLVGQTIDFKVNDAEIIEYDTDVFALQELAWGDGVKLDAVLIALSTGINAISNGLPIKQLGDPVYTEYLAAAVDKYQNNDPTSFANKVTEIIQHMHNDGTLRKFSMRIYGEDLTGAVAEFDVELLK